MEKVFASLKSIASYIPPRCISNADFEKTLDTSDEWISKRTGIKTLAISRMRRANSPLSVQI